MKFGKSARHRQNESEALKDMVDVEEETLLDRIPTAREFRSFDSTISDDGTAGNHSRYSFNESSYDKYLDGIVGITHDYDDDSGVGPYLGIEEGQEDDDWYADSFDLYEQNKTQGAEREDKSTQRQHQKSSLAGMDYDAIARPIMTFSPPFLVDSTEESEDDEQKEGGIPSTIEESLHRNSSPERGRSPNRSVGSKSSGRRTRTDQRSRSDRMTSPCRSVGSSPSSERSRREQRMSSLTRSVGSTSSSQGSRSWERVQSPTQSTGSTSSSRRRREERVSSPTQSTRSTTSNERSSSDKSVSTSPQSVESTSSSQRVRRENRTPPNREERQMLTRERSRSPRRSQSALAHSIGLRPSSSSHFSMRRSTSPARRDPPDTHENLAEERQSTHTASPSSASNDKSKSGSGTGSKVADKLDSQRSSKMGKLLSLPLKSKSPKSKETSADRTTSSVHQKTSSVTKTMCDAATNTSICSLTSSKRSRSCRKHLEPKDGFPPRFPVKTTESAHMDESNPVVAHHEDLEGNEKKSTRTPAEKAARLRLVRAYLRGEKDAKGGKSQKGEESSEAETATISTTSLKSQAIETNLPDKGDPQVATKAEKEGNTKQTEAVVGSNVVDGNLTVDGGFKVAKTKKGKGFFGTLKRAKYTSDLDKTVTIPIYSAQAPVEIVAVPSKKVAKITTGKTSKQRDKMKDEDKEIVKADDVKNAQVQVDARTTNDKDVPKAISKDVVLSTGEKVPKEEVQANENENFQCSDAVINTSAGILLDARPDDKMIEEFLRHNCCGIIADCLGYMNYADDKESTGVTNVAVNSNKLKLENGEIDIDQAVAALRKLQQLKLENGEIDIDQAVAALRKSQRLAPLPIKTVEVPQGFVSPTTSSITDTQEGSEAYKRGQAKLARQMKSAGIDEADERRVKNLLLKLRGRPPPKNEPKATISLS